MNDIRDPRCAVKHWTIAHQVTGRPARAWCSCSWEWQAQPGQDLDEAVDAVREHRRNPYPPQIAVTKGISRK